jgi:hypothetical protein
MVVFLVVTLYSLVCVYRRVEGERCFHLQGSLWRRQHVPSKWWYPPSRLYKASQPRTSQYEEWRQLIPQNTFVIGYLTRPDTCNPFPQAFFTLPHSFCCCLVQFVNRWTTLNRPIALNIMFTLLPVKTVEQDSKHLHCCWVLNCKHRDNISYRICRQCVRSISTPYSTRLARK